MYCVPAELLFIFANLFLWYIPKVVFAKLVYLDVVCFEESFDYAVIDMRLEDGSGLELIKKLKEMHFKK